MCSHWASPRVHSSREGSAHLHSLPGRTGSGGPGSSHGTDCMCAEVHSADTVQRKDTDQQSRWSVSIHLSYHSIVNNCHFIGKMKYVNFIDPLKEREHHIPSSCLLNWQLGLTLAAADMSCMPHVGRSELLPKQIC